MHEAVLNQVVHLLSGSLGEEQRQTGLAMCLIKLKYFVFFVRQEAVREELVLELCALR